jgi:hypothetical protein
VAIYPEILELEVLIIDAQEALRKLRVNEHQLVGQTIAADLQQATMILLPPMLERNIDELFMLGQMAGASCIKLVSVIWQHNALAERLASRVATMNAKQWPEALRHLEQHLNLLQRVAARCRHGVEEIHHKIGG